jgi:hypothetical protein
MSDGATKSALLLHEKRPFYQRIRCSIVCYLSFFYNVVYMEYGSKATSGITIISGHTAHGTNSFLHQSVLFQASFPVLSFKVSHLFYINVTARIPKAYSSLISSTLNQQTDERFRASISTFTFSPLR